MLRFLTALLLVLSIFSLARAQELPDLTVQSATLREGNTSTSNLNFLVSLSKASSAPIVLQYATRSQSAVANQDFTPISASLTIPANTTSATLSVAIKGDLLDENDETFALLYTARNVTLGASATGTIRDDDTLYLRPDNARITEGDDGTTLMDFALILSAPAPQNLIVNIATQNGSAVAGEDFRAKSGLFIPKGASNAIFSVLVFGDKQIEPDESFLVKIAPGNYTPTRTIVRGAIVTDDFAPGPTPTPVVPTAKIVFNQAGRSSDERGIFIVNDDGSNRTRLRINGDNAVLRPDGSKIAFSFLDSAPTGPITQQIFTMNADGTDVTQLTFGQTTSILPTWSPDGSQIAFLSNMGSGGIYVMNADGSDIRLLIDAPADGPIWSPDGSQIAFSRRISGVRELYLANSDGTNVRRLTDNSLDEQFPAWSPDGSQLVFAAVAPNSNGESDIYLINADGSGQRVLTNAPGSERQPIWNPDGSRIIFTTRFNSFGNPTQSDIFSIDTQGGSLTRLASNKDAPNREFLFPRFTPDGSRILYLLIGSSPNGIFSMNPDGSGKKRVTPVFNAANFVFGFSVSRGVVPSPPTPAANSQTLAPSGNRS